VTDTQWDGGLGAGMGWGLEGRRPLLLTRMSNMDMNFSNALTASFRLKATEYLWSYSYLNTSEEVNGQSGTKQDKPQPLLNAMQHLRREMQ
jgi:hypothetical protein